ncbi:Na+/H+ antiporter NhaC family protein [[Clostridium] polysaccharolyticum]|uniref:Transporter, NhaC family (TC 2.A.35) n=1 Tax=[Clostridium] polysaccharolyticum TaxID=29364 RepID=A0A1I0DWZ6_9FIRM|nr:Na+/H+ antiporter NhaC family protein [[Clostridium] polysaccharolyticum]SET37038.1 transporter, NhaC family (TC 2.A.35) [[Clostridium] polysaccharolyticum]
MDLASIGWLTLLPPLIAIILALITKEVISSLLLGILAGAFIYANGSIIGMLTTTFGVMGDRMGENINIVIFLSLLGAIVVIVTKGGGSRAYGEWAIKHIKTRKGASFAATALGCLIFIDDYFNCLTVGTVMKPVTDKYRISRAKLAYLLDATAAPICIIAPVSSWGASVATYIQEAVGEGNGMNIFIQIIPYNLYALLTIIMIVIVCSTRLNFGPMKRFEKAAIEEGNLAAADSVQAEAEMEISYRGHVLDLVIPIASLIIGTVIAMVYTGGGFTGERSILASFGKCDSSLSLVLGSFFALVVTFVMYLPRKILSFKEFMESISEGVKSMVPAFIILVLAWTIGGICSEAYLDTGNYVGYLVKEMDFPVFILPCIIFLVAAFLGFATGTSWGTMAILIPIGVSICKTDGTMSMLYPVLGAILAGAVYGDHISPISDTTILSSAGAGCNHLDHVSTQLVYASVVAFCCLLGYVLMGILETAFVPLAVSIVLLCVILYGIARYENRKEPIDFSNVE